jgi:hypothetical protein
MDEVSAELAGGFSAITALGLVIAEVLPAERLVPEVRSAEGPNGRPGTGQLRVPAARSDAGTKSSPGAAPWRCDRVERLVGVLTAVLCQLLIAAYATSP